MYLSGLTGGQAPAAGNETEFTKKLLEKAGIAGASSADPNAAKSESPPQEEEKVQSIQKPSSPPRSLSPLLDEALADKNLPAAQKIKSEFTKKEDEEGNKGEWGI